MSDTLPPKARLTALAALVESPGWAEVERELKMRHARAIKGACGIERKRKQRDADAGAASEIEQILNHVPALIESLTKKVEKEKREVMDKLPV